MGANLLVYTVSCDNEFKQDQNSLTSRWKTEKLWRDFRQEIINAIHSKDDGKLQNLLSRKHFLLTAHSNTVYSKKVDLVDLRGIELKNLNFQNFDMTYCCFDYAQLCNIEFNKTSLQYSSFNHATLKKVKFSHVQASPISATHTKLEDVTFEQGFFMGSDFRNSNFIRGTGKEIPNSQPSLF